jgi:hypothetical protein
MKGYRRIIVFVGNREYGANSTAKHQERSEWEITTRYLIAENNFTKVYFCFCIG